MDFTIDEDLEMLRQTAQKLVRDKLIPLENKLLAHGDDVPDEISETVEGFIEEMGVWSMNVPEEFDGVGIPVLGGCLMAFELGRTFIPVPVGDVTPILFECDEEQRKKYLEPVVERKKRMAVAFREARAGAETSARTENGRYTIDGAKICGKSGEAPDFLIVFARTLTGTPLSRGTTAFLVDRETPGLTFQEEGKKLIARFDGCGVSTEQVLGKPDRAFLLGKRWFPAVRLRKAAVQLGTADRLVEIAAVYARDWNLFGRPVAERGSVRQALADSAAEIYAGRMMLYHAACSIDSGEPAQERSMMVKLFVGELLKRVVARAVEIHGGPLPHFGIWREKTFPRDEHTELMRTGLARGMMKLS